MKCPECEKQLSAMSDSDGTAYWCIAVKEDGSHCSYSTFIAVESEEKPTAPTQYEYLRYRMGL